MSVHSTINLNVCLQGPTLTLRIKAYSLASDVAASQARPRMPPNAFKTAPLVVLNNFAPQQKHLALAASLFQGMFPSINVHNVNLATCQVHILLLRHACVAQLCAYIQHPCVGRWQLSFSCWQLFSCWRLARCAYC
jgi:hypothetical protein